MLGGHRRHIHVVFTHLWNGFGAEPAARRGGGEPADLGIAKGP